MQLYLYMIGYEYHDDYVDGMVICEKSGEAAMQQADDMYGHGPWYPWYSELHGPVHKDFLHFRNGKSVNKQKYHKPCFGDLLKRTPGE